VRRFTETGEPRASEGSSIGAAMRALPFGWATPVAATGQRRELTVRLSALDSAATTPMWEAAHGDWASPKRNMSLDAVTTMAIVLHVLRQATGMASAMKQAVALGGDTDTAAAIVGGILGSQARDIEGEIPWLSSVVLPESEMVEATAARYVRSGEHSISSYSVISFNACVRDGFLYILKAGPAGGRLRRPSSARLRRGAVAVVYPGHVQNSDRAIGS
jgi:hypothetical protein